MSRTQKADAPTSAEMRALRDARLSAQSDPRAEAVRHEQFFLGQMAGAKEHLDWIISHQAWVLLGFATFADWWEARAVPVAAGLGMRPTRDMAKVVIGTIVEEQKALPPRDRRSQKEIAGMVGVGVGTVNRQVKPSSKRSNGMTPSVPNGIDHDPVDRFPAVKDAVQKTLDAQAAAADADIAAADGEQSRASNTGSSAAGADVADQSAPAVNPEDHRDAIPGETDDAAAQPSSGPSAPAGVFGADAATEPEEPQPLATGDVEGQTPEGKPASAPPIPSWLRAVTAVNAAVYDLRQEDPFTVQLLIPADLNGELGSSVAGLVTFYKDMHKDLLDEESA